MATEKRSAEYWLHQIWLKLTGQSISSPGSLTVEGTGSITTGKRVDVTLMWDRVGVHTELTAVAATPIGMPAGAKRLLIQALSQNVRYTLDGSAPTTTRGFQLKAGDPPILIPVGANTAINVIQETATAEIEYQWVD